MILGHFWWSGNKEKKRIHWRHWGGLCVAKLDDGLGFNDFEAFNDPSLLASQWWLWIMNKPDNLAFKAIKPKYFPSCKSYRGSAKR